MSFHTKLSLSKSGFMNPPAGLIKLSYWASVFMILFTILADYWDHIVLVESQSKSWQR